MDKKVLIITPRFVKDICLQEMVERLTEKNYIVQTILYDQPLKEDEIIPLIKDVDGYIAGLEIINPKILDHAEKLKVIAEFGVGVDNIDIYAARKRGIDVTNSAGENSYAVAEMTIALMLSLSRKIISFNQSTKEGKWERYLTQEIRGKTLGIIGFGNIGKQVAKLAVAFGMNILINDIYEDHNFAQKVGAKFVNFKYLIKNSDFVSLHIPFSRENRHLIGEEEFKLMKSDAYFLNLSRGGIVDEEILYTALKENWIAGAAMDVFSEEKPGIKRLYELPNIIVSPHIASVTYGATRAIGLRAAQNVIDILENKECKYIVNL